MESDLNLILARVLSPLFFLLIIKPSFCVIGIFKWQEAKGFASLTGTAADKNKFVDAVELILIPGHFEPASFRVKWRCWFLFFIFHKKADEKMRDKEKRSGRNRREEKNIHEWKWYCGLFCCSLRLAIGIFLPFFIVLFWMKLLIDSIFLHRKIHFIVNQRDWNNTGYKYQTRVIYNGLRNEGWKHHSSERPSWKLTLVWGLCMTQSRDGHL